MNELKKSLSRIRLPLSTKIILVVSYFLDTLLYNPADSIPVFITLYFVIMVFLMCGKILAEELIRLFRKRE